MAIPNGTRLGQYEILSPLGAGGMGEVYRARDDRLGRYVAIKVLPAEVAADQERLRRFEQEARSASALNHPSIVTIYEFGESGSTRYIAMELVEGKTLKELVAPGPLPLRKVLSIASQVAEGLAKAHAAGIVHRDLKPENVMISDDGFVKILDFGLARKQAMAETSLTAPTMSGGLNLTAVGTVMGTIGYMSPEQASGRPVDFRSDQFSLASVIYEMGTGKRAFQKDTPAETLVAILRDQPEPIVAVNARVPAPLGWIVERCLAKEPGERYASTHDLARDLAAVRERLLEAPPETPTARETTLPAQRTRFVGRGSELDAAKDLLLRPDVRLLTLTGPGGIGKTRLALQAAGEIADQFPGGIFYVPLAPIGDPDLVAGAVSQALGARESGGPPLEALKEHLHSSRAPTLLLLDGFEHLIETAPIVAALVAAGPALKVLVTSRSPLHVYGEHEFPVPPLALPDLRKLPPLDVLARNEAVALFVQRAAAVKPGFAATEENAAAIADICARLDGLPLAIELAAARAKLLSPALMRARLEKRLHLLTGGARDLPERQQTLRGAIDWSHDLLNEAEQRLFRRLSVFVGGCTLEAAEAVCNAKGDLGLDVLEGMESLMDKSLVQQPGPAAGEPRFAMLETIREYALERLTASGDEPVTRRAHAAYGLVLAEEGASEPGQERTGALHRFDAEHGDFRAALDHLTQNADAEWGLRLATALFGFWETREYLAEGRERLDTLLKLPGATPRTRARALFAAGVLAGEQGDYAAAQSHLGESLQIDRELDDTRGIAVALNAMAVNALERGDAEAARSLFEEALALWRSFGDSVAVARSLSNLANVAKVQRDYATARSLHEETLSIFRDMGDPTGVAWALNHQADAARAQEDVGAARALYEESLAAFRDLGDRWGIAGTLDDLGNLARDQADFAGARAFYEESLRIFQGLEHRRGVARLLEGFAGCAAAERQPRRALLLAGAAAALREKLGAPLPRGEQARLEGILGPAREALPDRDSAAVWMEGWAMPLEKALEIALDSGSG